MTVKIKQNLKRWKLKWLHNWTYIIKHIEKWISYVIMVLCVILFILALCANVAHRLPVLSFFAKEMRLPYLLDACGKVYIYDKDQEIAIPVKILIGGYSVETISGEQYEVRFSATDREQIPIIICFVYGEEEYTMIEYSDYSDKYKVTCYYEYHLGE